MPDVAAPEALLPPAPGPARGRRARARERARLLRSSEIARVAGLAIAMVLTNLVSLVTTLAFGRILNTEGYGSLASLVSAFLILSVAGSALQAAVAREGTLGRLGEGPELAATLWRWTRSLIILTLIVAVAAGLGRHAIASVIGVKESWAAAATLPSGCIWLLLSVQRGLLQATGRYKAVGISMVGEQIGRLLFGVSLALAGGHVTGAFLGSPLAMAALATILGWDLHRRIGHGRSDASFHRLRDLAARGAGPIAGLTLVAVLQNVDVIVAKHQLSPHAAGAYASAAVAAKVVIWVAIGVGFYVLPEATRRHADGDDARPVLTRGLALIGIVAVPCLAIFGLFPRLLLRLAFGPSYESGSHILFLLGTAMSLLAASYLAVQFLLAQHRTRFLWLLAVIALAEPVLLLTLGGHTQARFVLIVFAAQLASAAFLLFRSALLRLHPNPR